MRSALWRGRYTETDNRLRRHFRGVKMSKKTLAVDSDIIDSCSCKDEDVEVLSFRVLRPIKAF